MFKTDPRSAKLLTAFQGEAEAMPRSLSASKVLYHNAPGKIRIRWNPSTGNARSVRGILSEAGEGSDEEIATRFLEDNRGLFGLPEQDTGLKTQKTQSHRGSRRVSYQQHYHGLPVVGADVSVHIDQADRVNMVNGSYWPDIDLGMPDAPISEEVAIESAERALQVTEHSEPKVERVIYPLGNEYFCAYKIVFQTTAPLGDWIFFIDAVSGDTVDYYNAINFAQGLGHVYGTNPLRDANVISGDLVELDESKGLSGSYFKVINAAKDAEQATPTGPGDFDFLFDNPDNIHFDEVMAYYHTNKIAKYFRDLGYREHSSAMKVSVHVPNPYTGDADYDNAYYSPLENALFFGSGSEFNDLAKEAAVIYHEYGHSVVNAVQPVMGTHEAGALHEGYADYFACSLTEDPEIGEYVVEPMGEGSLRDLRIQRTYDTLSETDVHIDGEIWGATCWKIREALGKSVADLLMYESLWYLPSNANFVDAAEGILQADATLFNEQYSEQLTEIFNEQKILTEPIATYSIVARASTGGSISPSGSVTVTKGQDQTFDIQANAAYYTKHVLVDGRSLGAVPQYTFQELSASHTIEAFFENDSIASYSVNAVAGSGGRITPSGSIEVSQGASQSFTLTPDRGYAVQHLLVDGVSLGALKEYSLDNVSAPHSLEALFVSAEAGRHRTVLVPGNRPWTDSGLDVEVGDILTFSASGTIGYDGRGNMCGPKGCSWADELDQEDPLWKQPHAGLIGKIEGIGAPFFIGASYTVKAGSKGRLLLGVNDFWYHANSGEFTVTIEQETP
jgi:Zn-dependent metalloprotease